MIHPFSPPKGDTMTTGLVALGTGLFLMLCAVWWIFRA